MKERFVLTAFGHVRYRDFVQLVSLSFLPSAVYSPQGDLSPCLPYKSEMLACKAVFVTYPRVKPSCEKSESSADVIPMLL